LKEVDHLFCFFVAGVFDAVFILIMPFLCLVLLHNTEIRHLGTALMQQQPVKDSGAVAIPAHWKMNALSTKSKHFSMTLDNAPRRSLPIRARVAYCVMDAEGSEVCGSTVNSVNGGVCTKWLSNSRASMLFGNVSLLGIRN
jgi:hypothetical protein